MKISQTINRIKRVIAFSLFVVTFVYILTGLGITEYRIVEPLTGGLLSKNLSFIIHLDLLIPFSTLLAVHIAFRVIAGIYSALKRRNVSVNS